MVDSRAQIDVESAPVEALISEMERAGVELAVLLAGSPRDTYTLDTAGRSRNFVVSILLDPLRPASLSRLEELAERFSVRGVSLRPDGRSDEMWINAPEAQPFWETVRQLALPVDLSLRSDQFNQLSDVVFDFPEVRIVIDRLGQGPQTHSFQFLPVLLEYSRYRQVYIRISGLFEISPAPHPHRDYWPHIEKIRNRFGAERMVWGSEFPLVNRSCGYHQEAQLVDRLPFLTPSERDQIRSTTSLELWFRGR